MLTRKHSIEGKHPFGKAAELFNTLDADAAMKLPAECERRPRVYTDTLLKGVKIQSFDAIGGEDGGAVD